MPVKIDGGVPYHADAYLYVPDKSKPSTWKLRIKERVGGRIKVTRAQLGRAAAALGPGFRGQRVQLPAGVIKQLKAKLRSLYRSIGVKPELIPPYIREQAKGATSPDNGGLIYEGRIQDLFEGPLTPKGTTVEIDEKSGVLKGVAMIGLISANRRRYKPEALKEAFAKGLYEGAPCYLDHNPDRKSGRRVRDLVGRWINTRFDEATGKGRGDLKTLQLHRELVIDIARNGPELAAPSHVAEGRVRKVRENGSVIEEVDHIERVYSVDLVAGAATVASLTENKHAEGNIMGMDVDKITLEELKTVRPDLYEGIVNEATGGEDMTALERLLKEQKAAIDELKKKLEEAESEKERIKKVQETKVLLDKHLKESKLPEKARDELAKLYEGQVLTEDQVKAIIEAQTRYLEAVLGKSLEENKLNIPADDGPTGNKTKDTKTLLAEGFARMAGLELEKDDDKDKE